MVIFVETLNFKDMKPYFFILITVLLNSCTNYNGYNPWFDENEEGIIYCKTIESKYQTTSMNEANKWSKWETDQVPFKLDRKNGVLSFQNNTYFFEECILPYALDEYERLHLKYKATDDEGLKCNIDMVQYDDGDRFLKIDYNDITYIYKIRKNYEKMLYMWARNHLAK